MEQAPLEPEISAAASSIAAVPAATFPWPPGEEENVIFAAGETWRRSLFAPARFFAEMPRRGYLSALAYYLPIGIIGAALDLFWGTTFDALGLVGPDGWLRGGQSANPALDRLLGFLISPLSLLFWLFFGSAVVHGMLRVLGAAREPFNSTLRVLAFSSSAFLLMIVPWLGTLAATIWSLVVTVIGLRQVHSTSVARAAAAVVLPVLILALAASFLVLVALLAGTALPI